MGTRLCSWTLLLSPGTFSPHLDLPTADVAVIRSLSGAAASEAGDSRATSLKLRESGDGFGNGDGDAGKMTPEMGPLNFSLFALLLAIWQWQFECYYYIYLDTWTGSFGE